MERRALLLFVASEIAGVATLGAALKQRADEPSPPSPLIYPRSILEFNVNNRLVSRLLLAIGASFILAPIGTYFSIRQERAHQNAQNHEQGNN